MNEEVLKNKKPRKKRTGSSHLVTMWRNQEYVMTIFKAFLLNISFGGIGEQMRRKPSVLSIVKLVRQTVMDVLEPLLEMTSRESHETVSEPPLLVSP